ncbi:OsmC family peroxiredoxin [Citroniella saccharovorans]|uniref:OsmC family peroxiredoxin n=1 Tax=Citroniella saccharovorans TaxID=2053367 RepID=A0AAW9MS78_9FIRM|nr:OsmC family peroxiredoxin [Citroniella saccharovorans]MEB3429011.1 OsmC family peroxiredoxin [Citroniella saccharovorans]
MTTEFDFFDKTFRAIVKNSDVKVYNEASGVSLDSSISFDSLKKEFTSIDYFVVSVVSELILTMLKLAKKKGQILQDLEAKVNLKIKNPMYLLNVVGYEEKSSIEEVQIDLYYFSFLEGNELEKFLQEVLDRTLIYNTFKDKININFKKVL